METDQTTEASKDTKDVVKNLQVENDDRDRNIDISVLTDLQLDTRIAKDGYSKNMNTSTRAMLNSTLKVSSRALVLGILTCQMCHMKCCSTRLAS